MKDKEINDLILSLNWHLSDEKVNEAIKKLTHINDEKVEFLLQPYDKKYWENAARVLREIGYPRNKLAVPGLLRWLQDMNWPGAIIAEETLKNIKIDELLPFIEDALIKAKEQNDTEWIWFLKLFINDLRLDENCFSERSIYQILELAED